MGGTVIVMLSYHPLAEETASGESSSFLVPSGVGGVFFVNITAVNGTLTVKVQESPDDENWYTVSSLTIAQSTTGKFSSTRVPMLTFADYTRICWTLTENGSATFSADLAIRT